MRRFCPASVNSVVRAGKQDITGHRYWLVALPCRARHPRRSAARTGIGFTAGLARKRSSIEGRGHRRIDAAAARGRNRATKVSWRM
jgi:hypothetical protein